MAIDPKLLQNLQQQQASSFRPPAAQLTQEPPKSGWQKFKSWLGNFFVGSPGKFEQVPVTTGQQATVLDALLLDAFGQLANPQEGFEPIEAETRRSFHQNTIPAITEQFQGGRLSSPVFASQLGAAGQGLESMLAAQKAQYGQNSRSQALQQLQLGLTPQFSTQFTPGSSGALSPLINLAAKFGIGAATGII